MDVQSQLLSFVERTLQQSADGSDPPIDGVVCIARPPVPHMSKQLLLLPPRESLDQGRDTHAMPTGSLYGSPAGAEDIAEVVEGRRVAAGSLKASLQQADIDSGAD